MTKQPSTMSTLLEGKVVVVTGAASGIGRTIAIRAAEHGAKAVIAADIRETPREGGALTTAAVGRLGVPTRFVATDVSERAQADRLVAASREFGGVDVTVCNAGITLRNDGADVGEDDFHRLMSVNVDGVLFGAQAAARQTRMLGRSGSIVLTGSMGGIVGAAITVAYSTSKGAVPLMVKALADALGPDGIRVDAVAPGAIGTALLRETPDIGAASEGFRRRTPLRRLGTTSEVGDTVAYLGSDPSSYVTGTVLVVDGDLTAVI